jgi:hypothetical protein
MQNVSHFYVPTPPPRTAGSYAQEETEEAFVPKQNSNNHRSLATGLELVNLLQSESFCKVITK